MVINTLAKIPSTDVLYPFNPNIKAPRVTIPQLDKDGKKIDPPKDADFMTFTVKDVTNKEQLIKIGESIFEELS